MRIPILSGVLERRAFARDIRGKERERDTVLADLELEEAKILRRMVGHSVKEWRSSSWDRDDDDEDDWRGSATRSKGAFSGRFLDLKDARAKHRELVRNDPTARGILRTLSRFCLRRPGPKIKLDAEKLGEKLAEEVLDFWRRSQAGSFSRRDGEGPREPWAPKRREGFWRKLRDGEMLLRFFDAGPDECHWRFVDPEKIAEVVTAPGDSECIVGFKLKKKDGSTETEHVDAADCVWRKIGTDSNEKRGLPYLFSCAVDVKRGGQWINDMGLLMHIRTAIGLIRRHKGAAPSQISAFADTKKTGTSSVTDSGTSRSIRRQKLRGGSIVDTGNTEYEYLEPNIDLRALVGYPREIGLRLVQATGLAEYLVRGDASNSALASLVITETPSAMEIEFQQDEIAELEIEVRMRELEWAVRWGVVSFAASPEGAAGGDSSRRLSATPIVIDEIAEAVTVSMPRYPRRERDKDVKADMDLVAAKIMSNDTAATRDGLDGDEEKAKIAEQEDHEVYPDRSGEDEDEDEDKGGDGKDRPPGAPSRGDDDETAS